MFGAYNKVFHILFLLELHASKHMLMHYMYANSTSAQAKASSHAVILARR